jgi:hypothetical protein
MRFKPLLSARVARQVHRPRKSRDWGGSVLHAVIEPARARVVLTAGGMKYTELRRRLIRTDLEDAAR